MSITVVSDGFTGMYSYLNGQKSIPVNQLDLARGILTCGKANISFVFKGGMLRIMEMIGLSMQAFAYTTINGSVLATSSLYGDLDRSEKGAASYRFGMGIAKIVSEVTIKVPWLIHVDPLIVSGAISLTSGSIERADLVGQDVKGDWHVVEAKARSNRPPSTLYSTAKMQASRILYINKVKPKTHCASIADLSSTPILVQFSDPEEESIYYDQVSLEINEIMFFREYYSLIRQFVDQGYPFQRTTLSTNRGAMDFMTVNLLASPYRLEFGCRAELIPLIRQTNTDSIHEYRGLTEELIANPPRASEASIGLDGHVFISTDIS